MKPIFTVITVHFNQLGLLKSTVENVVSQKGFGEIIEYIIVDGMSTDGTNNYLHELRVEKSIQRIIERDKGIYDAMNKGIRAASGDYLIFMNAGDQFVESDVLSKIGASPLTFDVLYGDTLIAYENFVRTAKAKPLTKFWQSLPFVHQSVIVKRELALENEFDLSYRYCADYNQLSLLYTQKRKFVYADKTISCIVAGGASDVNRVKATKEVFRISISRFGLGIFQKMYFRFKIFKSRIASFGKKSLPSKSVHTITKLKYR